jgi:hypothetical protein
METFNPERCTFCLRRAVVFEWCLDGCRRRAELDRLVPKYAA